MAHAPRVHDPGLGDLELLSVVEADGPFDLRRARPAAGLGLPDRVLARRPSRDRTDRAALATRLTQASTTSDFVSHHLVLQTHGVLETREDTWQLFEDFDGVALDRTRKWTLPVPAAVWLARTLLEALAHAHGLGVLHRAIGPSAVWVGRSGDVRLDFGLCTRVEDVEHQLTAQLDVRFSNPEWVARGVEGPQLDAYAVTALLWMFLTGRPFRTSVAPFAYRPASRIRPEIPPELDQVLEAGLDLGSGSYPSAEALADRLDWVFFRSLRGDDERHGRAVLAEQVAERLPERSRIQDVRSGESVCGVYTLVMSELNGPVSPGELEPPEGEPETPPEGQCLFEGPTVHAEAPFAAEPEKDLGEGEGTENPSAPTPPLFPPLRGAPPPAPLRRAPPPAPREPPPEPNPVGMTLVSMPSKPSFPAPPPEARPVWVPRSVGFVCGFGAALALMWRAGLL